MAKLVLVTMAAAGLALTGPALSGCAPARTHESAGEYVDDSLVTTKVKAALLNEAELKSFQISVETYKGVVQLSGFVDSAWAARRAGELASGIAGVTRVKNDLVVK